MARALLLLLLGTVAFGSGCAGRQLPEPERIRPVTAPVQPGIRESTPPTPPAEETVPSQTVAEEAIREVRPRVLVPQPPVVAGQLIPPPGGESLTGFADLGQDLWPEGSGDERDDPEALMINMEEAELYEVIRFFIDLLKINTIVEPDISGRITIHTAGTLRREDLFPLFFQILEANGLTAVKEGQFYRIISIAGAARTAVELTGPGTGDGREPGMILQIIPLRYINSEEMVKILTPFISEQASLVTHGQSKNLVLFERGANVDKILKLVRSFDVDVFKDTRYRFFRITHVDSNDISQTLSEVLQSFAGDKQQVRIINLSKLNSLLVIADQQEVFTRVEELITELDRPVNDVEPHIYLYFLKNSQADEMAGLLNSIFVRTAKTDEQSALPGESAVSPAAEPPRVEGGIGNPFAMKNEVAATPGRQPNVADFGSGSLRGEVKITADTIRNALVIDAIPSDYQIVERVLQRLDILPRQVLISVTIVDVQHDEGLDLGVEWDYTRLGNDTASYQNFITAAGGSSGLAFAIGERLKWQATLSALAQQKKVDIIATPTVLASDNIVANIDISTEVPVASAQIQFDGDDTGNRTQTDIQYRNTGIILNVTPHINEYGLVTMDISQEVSEQSDSVAVGNTSYPSFFKRSVKTTLTVNSNQTIVIGGLIRQSKNNSSSGLPFLSQIPLIGWLFGAQKSSESQSELIILITPQVVATPDEIDNVTEEFTRKVGYQLIPKTTIQTGGAGS